MTLPQTGEPSPKTNSSDVFQSAWYRFVLLFSGVYLAVFWFILGPSNPAYAMSVVLWTFGIGPAIANPLMRRLPRQWFQVAAGERVLHWILGVGIFDWLLDASGWNRSVAKPMRGFSGTRGGLSALERGVRANFSAHLACFAMHVLLAVLALFSRNPWSGALWMLLPGILSHLYPAVLQRSILLRLQSLLKTE